MYLARDVAEVRAGVGASAEEKEGGGGGGGEGEGEGEGEGDREGEGKKEGERLREGEGDVMGGYPVGRLGFRRQFSRMLQQLVRFKPDLVLLSLLSLSVLGCVLPRAHALVACCQMNHSRALRGITHSHALSQILVSAGFDAAALDEAHVIDGRSGLDLLDSDFQYMGQALRGSALIPLDLTPSTSKPQPWPLSPKPKHQTFAMRTHMRIHTRIHSHALSLSRWHRSSIDVLQWADSFNAGRRIRRI